MKIFPLHAIDFYKTGHIKQYPEGTEIVYSNLTARSSKHFPADIEKVVFFGLQGVIKWLLIDLWDKEFFDQPKDKVVGRYKRRMDKALGVDSVSMRHIEELHDLGYLPLLIKALPEGSLVNIKVPVFTIVNTDKRFFWLTNYIETMLSSEIWKPMTTATIAYEYRKLLEKYAEETGAPLEFIQWQAHDFSARGMSGIHDAAQSGAGHLLSFSGTDTVSALDYLEDYYNASDDFIGGSVPATEHSVMCMGSERGEFETFRRLIEDIYPSGVISIVSDTWDFWNVISNYAKTLKDVILSRAPDANGLAKVVFRPDSGNPADIICGENEYLKGAVEILWDIFGGTVTDKGYKVLNERVGLIYGDSITLDVAKDILDRLKAKGFASNNIVFGIGSYTYQYVTRDTLGIAIKATYGEALGERKELFKDPITDDGVKKSAKGLLTVHEENGNYILRDQQKTDVGGALTPVFLDGKLLVDQALSEIRSRLLK